MTDAIEGFYAAYLTAAGGNGMVLMALRCGRLVGADLGGVKYDGTYVEKDGKGYKVEVLVTVPPNIPLVQGMSSGPSPEPYTLVASFPQDFASQPFVRIEGKYGPVNGRFVKLRDLE